MEVKYYDNHATDQTAKGAERQAPMGKPKDEAPLRGAP